MANYDYACSECGHVEEYSYPGGEQPSVVECSECSADAIFMFPAPRINWWGVDPLKMDGEKEAIDCGFDE